jgi:cystathionine beta-synthase
VFAALQVAKKLDSCKTVVVILPDTGRNYLNKFYSDEWMVENGFLSGGEEKIAIRDILNTKTNRLGILYVYPEDNISAAIDLMRLHGVSQLPVIKDGAQLGSIRENAVMKKLSDTASSSKLKVKDFLEAPLPTVNIEDKIVAPLNLLKNQNAIAVIENNEITDIITTIDVINYLLNR